MRRMMRTLLATTAMAIVMPVLAQSPQPPQTAPTAPPAVATPKVDPNAVAATVNGQPIQELRVQRGLERVDPAKRREARPELINFLVDNLLIEQQLIQLGFAVDKAEVDKKIVQMKKEAGETGTDIEQVLQQMKLTQEELREHITADIRWDKFAASKATDAALKELFDANKEMFDGSMVRARHILIPVQGNDEKATQQALVTLATVKKTIDDQVTAGLAKLPATADNLAREKARTQLIDEAFAAQAREKSSCPSKNEGGDVKWFQRAGLMVEPFARAAFALKPFQISEVVRTQFGCHLIMVTDRKAGREVKFEDVKEDVKEIYCERLRESVAAEVRAKSKIVITPEN